MISILLSPLGCADRAALRDAAPPAPSGRVARTVSFREIAPVNMEMIESDSQSPPDAHNNPWTEASALPPYSVAPLDGSLTVATETDGLSSEPRDASREPEGFEDISLQSVLQIAFTGSPVIRSLGGRLLDNPAAAATIYDVDITASDPFFGPQAALAEFDSVLAAGLNTANNDRVFNNVVVGGNAQELVQDLATANASVQRRTSNGALFDLRGLNGYDANNRAGNLFPNYWETQLEAGVRQPLLRGAGRQFNSIAGPNAQPGFNFSNGLVLAQMNTQIERADFEIAVQQFTRDVHDAYWGLHRAYRSYDNKRQTRDLAYDTWQTLKAKASQKLEGGQIDKESQARQKYHRYQRAVIASLGGGDGEPGIYEAERRLRHLMGLPLSGSKLLRPSDAVPVAPVAYDWESLVASSMVERVELRRQGVKIRQQQMKLIASKNFLLPQLDLIGRYRVRGFGDDLVGDGPRFSSSYDDFFSFDHQELEFGVEWGATVGRRQARAAVRNASLQLQRERAVLAEQQRELTAKLSESVARTRSSYLVLQAGQEELEAAESRMRATWVLYEVDKTDLFMLLDARESLLEAGDRNVADQVQYTLSLVDVAHQAGRLLRDAGVVLTGCETSVLPELDGSTQFPLN
ncbi:MAG: TolC family protein [Planctomycetaceae bacterium]